MAFLASRKVRVVPLEELPSLPGEDPAVAVTFDDGFRNFAETAWPRLRDAGLPATVFLVTDHVGGDNRWGGRSFRGVPDLPLLDWDAAGRLAAEGCSIGSHTRRHPDLTALDDAAVEDELRTSRDAIASRTGKVPRSFAYPYGDCDERTAEAARRTYDVSVTTELRELRRGDDRALLPRLDAWYLRAPGKLESFGSPAFGRYVRRRAFLRRLRARLSGRRAEPYASSSAKSTRSSAPAEGASL